MQLSSNRPGASVPGLSLLLAVVCAAALSSCSDSDLGGSGSIIGQDTSGVIIDACPSPPVDGFPIVINEVMLHNESVLMDENGEFPPAWIELHNPTSEDIDMGGVTLSDDLVDTLKWEIPCVESAFIPAGGFLIIYLDGDTENEDDLHANFIPDETGVITFVLNNGSDIVDVDADLELDIDLSAGRAPDGGGSSDLIALLEPTPGLPNSASVVAEFVRGDVNNDGIVELADADLLATLIFNPQDFPPCVDALDVNDDGVVDISDPSFLYMVLEPQGPPIPAPFPEAGDDPTPDDLSCFSE